MDGGRWWLGSEAFKTMVVVVVLRKCSLACGQFGGIFDNACMHTGAAATQKQTGVEVS